MRRSKLAPMIICIRFPAVNRRSAIILTSVAHGKARTHGAVERRSRMASSSAVHGSRAHLMRTGYCRTTPKA